MYIDKINNIWTVITYNCNNRCSWCYADSNNSLAHKKNMSMSDFQSYIDLFKDLGVKGVILIGGEPTVHPNIIEMITYAEKRGIISGMVTNGRKLSNKDFSKRLYESGLKHLTISIESHIEDVHDKTTKVEGSFKETIEGLENILNYNIYTSSETTISQINLKYIEDTARYLSNTGLKKLGFNICTPCIANPQNGGYTLNPREGADAISKIYSAIKSAPVLMESITPLPKCLFDKKIFEEMNEKKILHKTCYILYGSNTVVDHDGKILPCVHYSSHPIMDLKKDSKILDKKEFLEEYNKKNGKPYKFRDSMWYYPADKCANDCSDFGKSCIAGCPVFWYKYNPNEIIT